VTYGKDAPIAIEVESTRACRVILYFCRASASFKRQTLFAKWGNKRTPLGIRGPPGLGTADGLGIDIMQLACGVCVGRSRQVSLIIDH
jgi:hypothetical protein